MDIEIKSKLQINDIRIEGFSYGKPYECSFSFDAYIHIMGDTRMRTEKPIIFRVPAPPDLIEKIRNYLEQVAKKTLQEKQKKELEQ